MNSISDLNVGDFAVVTGFAVGQKSYRQKLLSLGLIPGTKFKVTRIAPLGDPIEIEWDLFRLSLRKKEAGILQITRELG